MVPDVNPVRATLAALLASAALTGCAWLERNAQRQAMEAQQLVQQARDARDGENFDRANQLLSDAVAANPKDADAQKELADLLLQEGRVDDAIEHLKFAARLEPEDTSAWVSIARVYQSRRNFDAMEEPLENALTIEPTNVEGLWLGAQLEKHRSRNESALEFCHRLMLVDPTHVEAELMMATIHIDQDHPEQAAPLLRDIRSRPTVSSELATDAEWELGIAYGMQRRWGDAAGELELAQSHGRKLSADDLYRIAYAHHHDENDASAVRYANEVLKLNPADQDARLLAGYAAPAAGNGVKTASLEQSPGQLRTPKHW